MVSGTTRRSWRGAALDQHGEVQLLGRQPLQGVLADGPEAAFIDLAQKAILKVPVAQFAGVILAEDALHLGGGQDFADHVEDGVVVQGVADLLELLQQPAQDVALDGVGGHEVEDEAVVFLAVAVDAAHALLKAVGVPGDVVVEKDVAALEVDAFAGGLGGDKDLDDAVLELLLGVDARPRLIAGAGVHPTVDATDLEAPFLEAAEQVVERVLELGEDEQALGSVVEKALFFQEAFEA